MKTCCILATSRLDAGLFNLMRLRAAPEQTLLYIVELTGDIVMVLKYPIKIKTRFARVNPTLSLAASVNNPMLFSRLDRTREMIELCLSEP